MFTQCFCQIGWKSESTEFQLNNSDRPCVSNILPLAISVFCAPGDAEIYIDGRWLFKWKGYGGLDWASCHVSIYVKRMSKERRKGFNAFKISNYMTHCRFVNIPDHFGLLKACTSVFIGPLLPDEVIGELHATLRCSANGDKESPWLKTRSLWTLGKNGKISSQRFL